MIYSTIAPIPLNPKNSGLLATCLAILFFISLLKLVEFINSEKEPIVAKPHQARALSEGAAWLTTYLQKIGV